MKKSLALVGLLAVAGLGLGVLSGCNKDEPVDPDPTIVDNDGPQECDHNWVEDSHVDATCTEAGSVTYTCSICGETETLEVPALGHAWSEALYSSEGSKWVRSCERCGAEEEFTIGEDGKGIPEDAVLAVTSEEQLGSLTSIDGVTIALSGTVSGEQGEETESPFEFSSALSITGSDVTFVVGEGSSVSTGNTQITTSALISVADKASLTLELGEGSSFTASAGQYTDYGERNGVIDVLSGGELVINGGEGSTVTQSYSKAPVLSVKAGGKCTVNGGDFTVENSSRYTVVNDGELTINGGVFSTENDGSALIISGDTYNNSTSREDYDVPVLNINGGIFQGGKHVIKNALEGVATITGGSFDGYKSEGKTTTDLIDTDGALTYISGGTFGQDASNATEVEVGSYANVLAVKSGTDSFPSVVTITGGEFYKGTDSWFTFDDNPTAYDSVVIADSVWAAVLGPAIEAENSEQSGNIYAVTQEADTHVVISASVNADA